MKLICCIPVRNGQDTIERAIRSAWAEGVDDVYVFDDNSIDATDYILYGLGETHRSCLKTFHLGSKWSHAGVNFARNYLIEQIEDDDSLVVCLDADDTLHDIHQLLNEWKPNTWCYGDYNQVTGNDVQHIKGAPAGTLARKNITGVTFLFSKEDWIKCGGYNPNYAFAEDYAFQCNLVHHGIRPKYVETVVYDRYIHETGNPRTTLATEYWTFYHQMCKRDYPLAFQNT